MTPSTSSVHTLALGTFEIAALLFVTVLLTWPRTRRTEIQDDVIRGMQAVELRVEEDGASRTLRIPTPITIGRAHSATLVLSDAQVSRMHARIDVTDGVLTIRDLSSRNGTLVNARPIEAPIVLHAGDEIDIGTGRIVCMGVVPWT